MNLNRFRTLALGALAIVGANVEANVEANAEANVKANAEFSVQLGVEDFRWREFDAGNQIVKESGPRLILGLGARAPLSTSTAIPVAIELSGRLYFGEVDYDGQACDLFGNCALHRTDVEYAGVTGEALVVLAQTERDGWEVFAGGEVDTWKRDVQRRGNVSGANEDWLVMSVKGGVGWRWATDGLRYGARAGARFPFFTDETVLDDVELEPDGRFSPFAALWLGPGGERPTWAVNLYYNSYRFGESDHELVATNLGILEIWQPESKQDTVGLTLSVYFR